MSGTIIPFPSFGSGFDTPEKAAAFTDLVSAIYGSRSIGHSRDQFLTAAADLWDYIEHTHPTDTPDGESAGSQPKSE